MPTRALVVDDDPDQLFIVANVLRHLGIEAIEARSGDELLEQLTRHNGFDLVVTDVSMPSMTGVQAMRRARKGGHLGPVIVTTALRTRALVDDVADLGGQAFLLYKPFTLAALRTVVLAALDPAPRSRPTGEAAVSVRAR